MKVQAFHVDELLNEGDRVQKLRIFVLPFPIELYLRPWRGLQCNYLCEILVFNCLID